MYLLLKIFKNDDFPPIEDVSPIKHGDFKISSFVSPIHHPGDSENQWVSLGVLNGARGEMGGGYKRSYFTPTKITGDAAPPCENLYPNGP